MAILSENMVFSKTRTQDLRNVKQLNCWGSELTDVSLVKQMPCVQVLSLSVNNITSLIDFGSCKNLQELYLRENKIKDLSQLVHLQDLTNLKKLWLSGNPCTEQPNYRLTVLRALPNLEMLDNVVVTPDEVTQAEEIGDDLNSTTESCSSPERRNSSSPQQRLTNNGHEGSYDEEDELENDDYDDPLENEFSRQHVVHNGQPQSEIQAQRINQPPSNYSQQPQGHTGHRHSQQRLSQPDLGAQQWNVHQQQAPQQTNTRSPPSHLTNSSPINNVSMVRSASINDYAMMNSNSGNHMNGSVNGSTVSEGSYYNSAAAHGGNGPKPTFQRLLPKGGRNRNANILSAVLCLIKELDAASLEVVDTEIHCRMEEIGN
ncbi:hypothetical protein HDE_06870 [Halotydeus destructor]|nr:hypothetical protein HDE_06870 [Halotydeus destructor]